MAAFSGTSQNPGKTQSSESTNSIHSPRASSNPRVLAALSPLFSVWKTRNLESILYSSQIRPLESVDPSSIMTNSTSSSVCAFKLSRHCLTYFSTLYTGTITDTIKTPRYRYKAIPLQFAAAHASLVELPQLLTLIVMTSYSTPTSSGGSENVSISIFFRTKASVNGSVLPVLPIWINQLTILLTIGEDNTSTGSAYFTPGSNRVCSPGSCALSLYANTRLQNS